MYHVPRGKGFFLPWLTFHLGRENRVFRFKACLAKKNGIFKCNSMFLRLGELRFA